MKIIQTSITLFLVLASFVLNSTIASAEWVAIEDPAPRVFQKNELPVGGVMVPHPKDKQAIYYILGTWKLRENTSNAKKSSGLYGSTDGGQTWKLLVGYFEFKSLFINPNSGELFALIEDNIIAPNENGFLTVRWSDKAIRSTDGKHWKDIMGKQQRASGLSRIFVDPEYPNRVRLRGHAFRPYELVAVDDNYSDWKRVIIPTGSVF